MKADDLANKAIAICYVMLIITIFYLLYHNVRLNKEVNHFETRLDHFKMYYNLTFNRSYIDNNKYPTGLYYNKFMCIWLENRNYIEALETFNHEWQHYKYKNHFNKTGVYIENKT